MTNSNKSTCPSCGADIPLDAPEGLCPACALENAASAATATGSGRATPPPTVEEIAPHFPELEIVELLGAGGMGAVYKARQPQLDRFVALKILSHDLAADPAFAERFNREARVLARLSHPNIVGIYDFGTAGPYCYFLMELVDGVNLRQAMQAGPFSPAESLAMVENICAALKFAHEEGILHRDIKPENVLIDSKGRVKIADFGIAKLIGENDKPDVTLTIQGSVLGSPHYMAPEQIESPGDVDQRADIYSLGVVLYELLTGELPIGRFALPSEKKSMDARIDEIVLRTLEKERQARFQSAEEMRTSVGALAQSPPVPPQVPDPQPTGECPTAKFSLTSALLTGASLILIAVFLWLYLSDAPVGRQVPAPATATEMAEGISARLPMMVLGIVNALLGAGTALVGFFLGAKALGDIRESGGRKRGLGFATFGTLAWPVILLFFLAMLPTSFLMVDAPSHGGGGGIPTPIVTLVVLVAGIAASFWLVRSVVRWAGGVDDGNGRRHPGFGGSLIGSVMTAVLVPALMVLLANMALPNDQPDAFADGPLIMERKMVTSSAPITRSFPSAPVDWYRGGPELTIPVRIHDSFRAEFRLALFDGKGNPQKYAEIGTWTPSSRRSQIKIDEFEICAIHVGTTGPKEDGTDGSRDLTAVIDSTGESGTLTADTDFAGWDFDFPGQTLFDLPLATAGTYDCTFAKREEMVDGKTKVTGSLRLEVRLINRQ